MLRKGMLRIILVLVVLAFTAGCTAGIVEPQENVPEVPTPSVAAQTATEIPAVPPTQEPQPEPSATPQEQAGQPSSQQPTTRPASGWTTFSNPDFVQGLAIQGNTLWAATLGGVVAWNLERGSHILYTTREGLVEIQGNDVVYCSRPNPRIIVAHDVGILSVYDLTLKKWGRIPITFPDGETMRKVQSLYCDGKNNRLLIGSQEGLGILDYKTMRWRRFGSAEGLKVNDIRAIDVVGQTIWIAAGEDSAFFIMGSTIFPFSGTSGFPIGPVNDLSVSTDGTIWLGYPTGLVHYIEPIWKSYSSQSSSGLPFKAIDHVEVGPNKIIWIAGENEGICPLNTITFFCSTIYPVQNDINITDLVVDSKGIAYAGTDGSGLMVLDDEDVRYLVINDQRLMSNDIWDIAGSSDGRVWVATDRGVNVFDPSQPSEPWEVITPERGKMAFPQVSGLQASANGMWIFYDQQDQASFFDGMEWTHIGASQGISGSVLETAVDYRGYTWFVTSQNIHVWDGTLMRSYGPSTGLPGNLYRTLMTDDETMWIGSDRGLLQYSRFQWRTVLPDIPINAIIPGEDGGLLLGTDIGLVNFDGRQSFLWIINLGDEVIPSPKITTLAWDQDGHLWAGTDGDGLFHYDGIAWERFNTARGLPTDTVRKVYVDPFGAVWIAAATGNGGGALVRFVP